MQDFCGSHSKTNHTMVTSQIDWEALRELKLKKTIEYISFYLNLGAPI